ncbi:MAG: aminopeptidase P N-terminal domain-containing protein [Proteobacteria bacterium]|nr:aminopeptidase P N-terminal domain-containing protein [Pseudomonadota bacterium]
MFAERRQRVLDAMGSDGVAIFVGARMVTRSNDTEFPFRQDSDLLYLTGFDHPDAVAVLRTEGGPAFTLFVQPRQREAETWTGRRPGVEGATAEYGADEAHPVDALHKELPEILKSARRIYHVLGRDADLDRKIVEILEDLRRRSRIGLEPASEIVDPRSIVHEMRLIKSPEELDIMRRGQEITRDAHREAARLAQPGRNERELEAVLDYTFRRQGGSGPAYTSIVGGGVNATILHYVTNDQELRAGEMVLIDGAAEYQGYASDVTRTYPIGGRFQGPCRAVYETVLAAQDAAVAACTPGTTLEEVHQLAVRVLVEGMVGCELLSGTVDDLVAAEAYKPFYMHRTSHWLGLDVHDVGSYSQDGKPRPLEPGMVLTVEPGIYVAEDDEKADERFRGIGVRIEDDVLITTDGHEVLSAEIPKRLDEVEAWVSSG